MSDLYVRPGAKLLVRLTQQKARKHAPHLHGAGRQPVQRRNWHGVTVAAVPSTGAAEVGLIRVDSRGLNMAQDQELKAKNSKGSKKAKEKKPKEKKQKKQKKKKKPAEDDAAMAEIKAEQERKAAEATAAKGLKAEKDRAAAEFAANPDLIVQVNTPVLTSRGQGASVPRPEATKADTKLLQKLTEEELRLRIKELQEETGQKFDGLKKYSKEQMVKLLAGKWEGWIRREIYEAEAMKSKKPKKEGWTADRALPKRHKGRLTNWMIYCCACGEVPEKVEQRSRAAMAYVTDGIDDSKKLHDRYARLTFASTLAAAHWRGLMSRRHTDPLLAAHTAELRRREQVVRTAKQALRNFKCSVLFLTHPRYGIHAAKRCVSI